ncbi:MAG: hypothetical protein Q8P77_00140 [Candidatus Veblenbacteria bacterium]|nr:hypothetical protein [Candidatus Veblenbacteria bacterium]
MFAAAQPPYWFKPARFWKWFAAYYPVSWQGWLVTLALLVLAVYVFRQIDGSSHSASDALIGFALPFVFIAILFDFACRLKGEYPWWWHKQQ